MRFRLIAAFAATALLVTLPASAASRFRRGPTSTHKHGKSAKASRVSASRPRAIDDERATQIQTALIKSGYMTGEPSGHWDTNSQAAMEKLQSDNGWQTKLVPDSRALIKLGLGGAPEAAESHETVQPARQSVSSFAAAPDTQNAQQ